MLSAIYAATVPARAEPYYPAADDVVLATVPRAEFDQRDTITALRAALDAAPDRADIAARLARTYLDLNSELGDPRYIGYARAAIEGVTATAAIRLARADLLQASHQFAAARNELASLLRGQPANAAAWLMLASVSLIQGDYAVARNACARLALLGHDFEALACSAETASLGGNSVRAYEKLSGMLDRDAGVAPEVAAWGHQIAAGIARRLGDTEAARRHLQASLDLRPAIYTLVTLADLLLEERRSGEAWRLLAGRPEADTILLRQALAARRLQHADADELTARASRRMLALQQRGDRRHAREEAWHALHIADRPEAALAAAERNWQTQRESADAELLLRAALAARRPAAAAPVLDWMRANTSDDVVLESLARQIGSDS